MTDATPPPDTQSLADRYAEMASLAGGLAHEIRNPLSTISLNLELLEEDVAEIDAPSARRMTRKLGLLRRESKRLEEILDAFLQFVRLGKVDAEPLDLNVEVAAFITFIEPQADEAGVEIRPHLAIDLPGVRLDPNLFRQVLQNLTRNALAAMPEGGKLEFLTTRRTSEDGADDVCLSIIDSGVGMNAETRTRIFDAFFSTSKGGSGLGLPTVRRIVEAHGGSITCESEPGQGTRFTLCFPVTDGE